MSPAPPKNRHAVTATESGGEVLPTPAQLAAAKWRSSGLTDEHAKKLRLRALSREETAALAPNFHRAASLRVGYFDTKGKPTDFYRVRYLEKLPGAAGVVEKPQRYAQATGSLNEVYLPPLLDKSWEEIAADTSIPTPITEGELKAASACVLGFACIGLGGVEQWRASKRGISLLPGLVSMKWEDRNVCIIFDSDSARNPDVMRAASGLAVELAKRGASVSIARLPDAEKCRKGGKGSHCKPDLSCGCQGLDDFIVAAKAAGRDPRAAVQEVIDAATPHLLSTFAALGISYTVTAKGRVIADKLAANVEAALVFMLGNRIELDERAGVVVLRGKKLVEGSERNAMVAELCRFCGWSDEPRKDILRAGIAGAAARHAFDPVVRYLDRLPPRSGASVMPDLVKACGVEVTPENVDIMAKWAIGAVRRARDPGVKMDTTLVLQGEQGMKKTSAFETLACAVGSTAAPSFTRASQKVKDKDALMKLQGPWIVELAELATVRGAENDRVKQFLDEREDFYRPPYAENFISRPRRVVFAGTTNEPEYLSDATGARRYWLLPVTRPIDLDWIRVNADRVWAEADARAKSGEVHWYESTPEWMRERHEQAHEEGALEERIEEIVAREEKTWKERGHFKWSDLLPHLETSRKLDRADEHAIGRKLRRLGFEKGQRRTGGTRKKVWRRPEWPEPSASVQRDGEERERRKAEARARRLEKVS